MLVLALLYTLLSNSRQAAAKRDQRQVAESKLEELQTEQSLLGERRNQASELEDEDQRQVQLSRVAKDEQRINDDLAKFTLLRDAPDKADLTVPSWIMLYRQGLVRSCTPQGAFKRKEVWITTDFKATIVRLVTALVLGIAVSLTLGMLMGCFDALDAFFTPPFALLSKVPATAVLPIFFVLIQINFKLYLAIIVFGMLPSLAQSISASVRKDVPEELIFKAYTLGASQLELIWEVIFKQVLPRVLDAARLQIGPALVLLVAAEWMVAGEGIGYRLRLFYQRTDMTVVFVYVAILGVLGLATDYALMWTRRKLCPWFGD
jgi:NitT/TauT family transport system permease protein